MSRILIPTATLTCFILAALLNKLINFPAVKIDLQKTSINIESQIVKLSSLGLKRSVADLMWIKTLLDSDLEHYEGQNLGSWMYLRFNTISELDPKFYENYHFGGQYLMVVKDDLPGAEKLLQKGLSFYPEDFYLNFHLGYMFAIEMGEVKRAAPYFIRVKNHPERPRFFDSLFAKIVTISFGPQEALPFILEAYNRQMDDGPVKKRLKEQLYTVNALIDLNCLEQGHSSCRKTDINGDAYYKDLKGKWRSPKPLVKMKLFSPKEKGEQSPP